MPYSTSTMQNNRYYFYVLYSLKDFKLYKGYSSDPAQRLLKHNAGATASTKHRRPLILIYIEQFELKSDALDRERWAKSAQGGPELKLLLIQKNILTTNGQLITERP